MNKIYIMNIVIILMMFITGCNNNPADSVNNLSSLDLVELESKLLETQEELKKIEEKLLYESINNSKLKDEIRKYEQIEFRFRELQKYIDGITRIENLNYEIIYNTNNEIGLFVKDVPKEEKIERYYLLKLSILYSDEKDKIITLWSESQPALDYYNQDYDNEETLEGWSGFDSRFGEIDNETNRITYFYSRADATYIDFGKYTSD
ncbi:hypothetical protein [Chengkuizengella marina]|uniref:Lipoprotein n=1 Tax=Chengkuizengella marina TaxID=2507566 RepID=A0A6N9PZF0_9BACL|nr:hypothetical protein [Chengkuizengella marina]NBI28889.1 hypothetical protein [Chengkuizengella marina]